MGESSGAMSGLDRRGFLRAGLALGGAVAGAGLLGACGGPGGSASGGTRKGLSIGTVVVEETLNPMQEQYTTFQFNAFDSLVRQLRGTGEAEARLAEEWTRRSDTVWRFKLRPGVTFHNGAPVTADDVVFSFTELLAEQYALASLIPTVDDVRKVDATTVEIETKEPDALLLSRIGQIFVVPKKEWESKGADGFAKAPVGSGPFRIESFSVDRGIEFAAYDGYWGTKPKTPEITLRYFSDPGAMASALEAGQIDAAQNLGAETIKTLADRDDLTVATDFSGNQNMFQLNTTKAPFDDARVRQAAIMALDVKALIDTMTYGSGVLEDGQLPVKGVFGYSQDIHRPGFDPAEAKRLLRSAGAEGAEVEIFGMSLYKKLYEAIGAQLKAAGFQPKINAVEVPVWVKTFRAGSDAHIFYRGASYTGIFDADRPFSHVSSSKKPFVKDAEWDDLMTAQRTELDKAKREQKLAECSRHLLDKSYVLYTYGAPTVGAHRRGVTGFDNGNGLMLQLDGIAKREG
ncbi:ABC transporter substrate-binding protein [Actinomadura sp. KC345]|uniref:ABC transporter substrate-binding protein n=1 Tax=Actinomadura sp. KC345 TaxID=2530371 RepID=UPI00104E4E77|nr:ABC transporter substrate-binding protein [Actinomadura sp. KC345]TDC47066.1 ABC transporter substrate-binding protein [Actinomadura sp. KC345]